MQNSQYKRSGYKAYFEARHLLFEQSKKGLGRGLFSPLKQQKEAKQEGKHERQSTIIRKGSTT